jgi:RNA polymerase sigma factor (sigma-70 family)
MSISQPLVYVVDDDASVRKSLGRLLKSHGFQCEVFATADDFLSFKHVTHPACLVLDLRLPGLNGLALQEEMQARKMTIPIIFISGHGDIPTGVKAMKAGAVDFLPKPFSDRDLLDAVTLAIAKGTEENKRRSEGAKIEQYLKALTPRELDVMKLVIKGMLNKQIAAELGISIKTVKVHRGRVMQKMQAKSVAELVRLAEKAGIEVSDKEVR